MFEFLFEEAFYIKLLTIAIYIAAGFLIYFIIKGSLTTFLKLKLKTKKVNEKRSKTINSLLINLIKYLIIIIIFILSLGAVGVNTTSLLASLGILSLVLGLALQDTIKDLLAGIFIITERQYEVGDNVTIGGFTGEIIELGLKTTKIKGLNGEIKIIGNSNITEVINYSQINSIAIIDVGVDYDESTDKIIKILNNLIPKISEIKGVKKEIKVLGVQDLADSAVVYRMSVETEANEHYRIRREVLKLIKDEFDNKKVKIPYPQVEVHNGQKI